MKMGLRKDIFLMAVLCGIFATFNILPSSFGYGTSIDKATVIYNGVTNETMYVGGFVYYKICCKAGDSLSANLTDYGGAWDLDLAIIAPDTYTILNFSTAFSDYVTTNCNNSGWYYFRVHNFAGLVPSTITLTVAGATGSSCDNGIAGFEFYITLIGLIAALFFAIVLWKHKYKPSPNSSSSFLI